MICAILREVGDIDDTNKSLNARSARLIHLPPAALFFTPFDRPMTHELPTAPSCPQVILPAPFRSFGRLYKLAAGAMALDRLVEPAIDTTRMSASAVISTPTPDRGADVLLPEGMRVENYRKNPVVLWEHGLSGIDFPIAKSEDPEGRLALAVSPAGVTATAFFTTSSPESEQIFALIAERIIRGASVRAMMLKTRPRRGPQGEIGLVVDEWDLEEWSWVAVPANPDAVAQVLHRGRLCGRSLAEPLRKSLAATMPTLPVRGVGWTAETSTAREADEHREEEAEDAGLDAPIISPVLATETLPASLASPFDDDDDLDDDRQDAPDDDDTDFDDDGFDDDAFDDDRDFEDAGHFGATDETLTRLLHAPLGARVLSKLHERLSRLARDLETTLEPVEQPEVREHLASLGQQLHAHQDACRERYLACYPRLAPLDAEAAHAGPLPLERRMAKFLAAPAQRAWWQGLSGRLLRMASSRNIPTRDARWLRGMAAKMAGLVNQATTLPAELLELPASLLARLDALEDRALAVAELFPVTRRAA